MSFLTTRIEVSSLANVVIRVLIVIVATYVSLSTTVTSIQSYPSELLDNNPGTDTDIAPIYLSMLAVFSVYFVRLDSLVLFAFFISPLTAYLLYKIENKRIKIIASGLYISLLFYLTVLTPALLMSFDTSRCGGFLSSCPSTRQEWLAYFLLRLYGQFMVPFKFAVIILLTIFFKFPKKEPSIESGVTASDNQQTDS